MRPLTNHCPKPLLNVRGQPLIAWHVRALAAAGVRDLMINTAWLGDQIEPQLRPLAAELGCQISYSHEGLDFGQALETAGGIARALPALAEVFWVVAGDVYMPEFGFPARSLQAFSASPAQAHLWLVPNPPHHPRGDFGLSAEGRALSRPQDTQSRHPAGLPALGPGHAHTDTYTFSTVALYKRRFFAELPTGNPQGIKAALAPMLRKAMDNGRVSAELYTGPWTDVGTPERLAELNGQASPQPDRRP